MGYVPPSKPYGTYTSTLETLARVYDISVQYASVAGTKPRLSGYRKYIDDLYGHRPTDHFMALNYAMLACIFALATAIAWWWFA